MSKSKTTFIGMNSPDGSFVGAHTHRATPVPIPNTAVKPVGPMILLQRESRSVPAFKQQPLDRKVEGFFVGLSMQPLDLLWRHAILTAYAARLQRRGPYRVAPPP